jgi:HSP20 family protein
MAFVRFTDRPAFRNPWAEFERIRQGLDELSRTYVEKGKGQRRANVYPTLNIYE